MKRRAKTATCDLLRTSAGRFRAEAVLRFKVIVAFACVAVSHDRYLLENIASDLVELNRVYEEGLLRVKGNYSAFKAGPAGKWRAHEPPSRIDQFVKAAYLMREWVGPADCENQVKSALQECGEHLLSRV